MLHEVQSLLRIRIQLHNDDVIPWIQHARHVVESRIGGELARDACLGAGKSTGHGFAALLLWPNEGD